MDCQSAQRDIIRYVDSELSIQELHAFLNHIDNCKRCYEELETYFIFYNAARRLDSDVNSNLDFHELFCRDLGRKHRRIRQYRTVQWLLILLLASVTAVLGSNIMGTFPLL